MMYRVASRCYVCAIISEKGRIVRAPPACAWTIGKRVSYLRQYFGARGISFKEVNRRDPVEEPRTEV